MCQIVKRPEVRFPRPREIFTSHSAAIMYVWSSKIQTMWQSDYVCTRFIVGIPFEISFLNHIFSSMVLPST